MPDFAIDDKYVLTNTTHAQVPTVAETYIAETIVRQYTKGERHLVNTGSRTIIDDIFLWSTTIPTVLLLYECVCRVCIKYRLSLKIKRCQLFKDRFEHVGRDILTEVNTTAQSKYDIGCG